MRNLTIPILMYHQVDVEPPKGAPMRGLVVAPASFARQMFVLNALGYRGLSMNDLLPYLRGDKQGKVFGITFDDGYENNLRCALPVLQHYGFTATCYVVADLIGQTNSWDNERGVKPAPLMTADQLKAWVNAGQEVGSHTLSHADLEQLDAQRQSIEIGQSKTQLDSLLGPASSVRHFCYPYGRLNDTAVGCVKTAGYLTATTTVRGRVPKGEQTELLLLPRVLVSRTTTWVHLLLKCFTRYEDKRGSRAASDVYT